MSSRLAILLALAVLAAPAHADLLADAAASDAAVEERVRSLLAQALLGDASATEAQVHALEALDAERAEAGVVRTGLTDDARYLAAGLWLTRDGRRRALEQVLDTSPDPVVRRLAEHRIETDDAAAADRLLADDAHNRRASLLNGAVRPLGIFSGAAFLAALNPFIMAGSAVDSAITTAVNLWHYNRLSTPEREALARYRRQVDREPRTQDPEMAEAVRRLGAKRTAALCDNSLERATDALDDGDLDHAAYYVHEAANLDGCADRAAEPEKKLERALAQHEAKEDAARWPVDDPPRAASEDERRDHEAVVVATALGEPAPILAAAEGFRERHPRSKFGPATELASALATDLSGRRPDAQETLDELADDDDGSAGRSARRILDGAEFTRLDAIRAAENKHTRDTARFVLLGPPNGRNVLYSAAQLGAEGVRAAQSIGIFNVMGVATRAWQAWRKDPISNQEIIDRGEKFLAREPTSKDVPQVHERLAEAYERAQQYPRALMHYKLSEDPDADHVADLEDKVAEQLLGDAQKRGNDPVLLTGIADKFGSTEAGEKARALLEERGSRGELVLERELLLEHPALLGPDALDLDPRLLDGDGDNGELADGGVTLAEGELRLALRGDDSSDERVETRTLEPQPYSRARAAAQEVLYTRLLTSASDEERGRFERYVPFFITGTVDPGGGFYIYPGVKTRQYQSADQRLYE